MNKPNEQRGAAACAESSNSADTASNDVRDMTQVAPAQATAERFAPHQSAREERRKGERRSPLNDRNQWRSWAESEGDTDFVKRVADRRKPAAAER